MDKLPIYRFYVPEDDEEIGVSAIAMVDFPAIELGWQAFKSQFVIEPKAGETQDEFMGRCIPYEIGNGYEKDQAAAMCYAKWDKKEFAESYTDYPKQASENAKIALRWAEENGWGECGTAVGKERANQLANREPISRDTIARMAAFERQRQNSQKELGDGCGRLMWLAWGGDEGVEWASRKLEQIDKDSFEKGVPHYTKDGKLYEGPTHKDASGRLMTGAVHTIDSEYLYHEDELKSLSLKFTSNVEKRIISGPLMISNLPIYRKDETGEYYGVFTSEDIYNIVKKFFRNNNTAQVNMMHDSNAMVKGVYMIESFIIDSKRGIYSPAGYNLTEGSWFGSFKVDNEDVWENYIKSGEFKGFSVEGLFKTIKMTDKPKTIIDEIIDVVKNVDPSKVEAAKQILKKANI